MRVAAVRADARGVTSRWHDFEAWVGTRASALALFGVSLLAFGLQSLVLPAYAGRDLVRYVQTYVQFGYDVPVLPSVLNTRGPIAALGVGLPLELGGVAAEIWLALLYAGSIVAWAAVARTFGPRAAIATAGLLLVYPGYAILFHGLAGDALFAAGFAGWSLLLSRALLAPSVASFAVAGAGMGALVLIRPPNQVLIVLALAPLFVRGTWERRLAWSAAFVVASVAVSQSWKALAALLWGDAVTLRPTTAGIAVALLLVPLLLTGAWRRRLLLVVVPLAVVAVAAKVATADDPLGDARAAAQAPPLSVFLFRAFVMDKTVEPDNGPASRELAHVVDEILLPEEPYRSYDVDREEFFSSGSERIFGDIQSLGASADLEAVTREAIRAHPTTFASGIARAFWQLTWTRRVYAPEAAPESGGAVESGESTAGDGAGELPRPTGDEPIPSARIGPTVWTVGGGAREVWRSATEHPLVFDDPRDERRYERFGRDTERLASRLHTRDSDAGLVHRANQASRAFPPPLVWLVAGLGGLAVRRPRRSLVAVAPAVGALAVIGLTSLIALPVPEYSAPVSPAFILLAAAGLLGAEARRSGAGRRLAAAWSRARRR